MLGNRNSHVKGSFAWKAYEQGYSENQPKFCVPEFVLQSCFHRLETKNESHPPGALASVPGWLRYAAVAAGFASFVATRRSTLAGVICGELVMLAGKYWLG